MAETHSAGVDRSAADDLISFLKVCPNGRHSPEGRYRRGVRYTQWFLLLMAVRGILRRYSSLRDQT